MASPSHRRKAPRKPRGVRRSAATALAAGLAITVPLMLRGHPGDELVLAPGETAPAAPPTPASSGAPATAGPSHTGTAVSRDATRSAPVQSDPGQATSYQAQVVALTNQQRIAHGCPALRDDPRLRAAALAHSADMRVRDYFEHDTPDGVTPWTRVEAQGYPDPSAENIALGQQTPQAVVAAWMNSPGHRANILNCSSKAIGVGVQFGPGGPWWTQDFGFS